MRQEEFSAWIEKDGKVKRMLGTYYAFNLGDAKILAKADAIKAGLDTSLVKVVHIKRDED